MRPRNMLNSKRHHSQKLERCKCIQMSKQCFPQVENLLGGGEVCVVHCFASIISTGAFSAYYYIFQNYAVMFTMIY